MSHRVGRVHPALKHGAYSAMGVLPGENRAEFEKLHRELVNDFSPSGALENDIVAIMARLLWRKKNLRTLNAAKFARDRYSAIVNANVDSDFPPMAIVGPGQTRRTNARCGSPGPKGVRRNIQIDHSW